MWKKEGKMAKTSISDKRIVLNFMLACIGTLAVVALLVLSRIKELTKEGNPKNIETGTKTLIAKMANRDVVFTATQNSARVKMQWDGQEVLFIEPMYKPVLEQKDSRYIFIDTATHKQFVYSIVNDTLKQDIILVQPLVGSAAIANPFPVQVVADGLAVDINGSGEAVFTNVVGQTQFVLQAPWAKDAKGNETKTLAYRLDDVSPNDAKNTTYLTLILDQKWFTDPARVYPITIDPTVATIGNPATLSQQSKYCPPGNDETNCAVGQQPAPKAEYNFDDAVGSTVTDSSGNAFTGTFIGTGSHWSSQGKINFAGIFNGTDDFVDIGTGPTGIKSVGFWVYPASTTEYFADLNGSAYIWANAGAVTATGFTTPTIYVNGVIATTIVANTWQYIMVTSATAVDAGDLDLGRLEGTDYLQGRLDQVRLYNYVRTAAQMAWDFNMGAPTTWYKFNENTGTLIGDWGASGSGYRGNNLTLTIGAGGSYTTSAHAWTNGNPGKIATALALDGTDDYAATGSVALMAENSVTYTSLSWGAWVKPVDNITRTIIQKNTEFRLRLTANSLPVCQIYSSGAWQIGATSSSVVPVGSWSHVLCTYDGANIKIYVNGVLKATQPQTGVITSSNATALNIGRDSAGSEYYLGTIDEVRVYGYALSPTQVKVAKNDGIVAYGRAPVTAELPQSVVCGNSFTVNHLAAGGVAPVDKTVTYATTLTGIGGTGDKCWITKNLGASAQAGSVSDATEAVAGWYWQFNRKQGYKYDTSRIPATAWDATDDSTYTNWDPAKDPCTLELGAGWRLPTYTEYYNMDNSGGWTTWTGPWGSVLKLHAAGYLLNSSGGINFRGADGLYWSSTQANAAGGWHLYSASSNSSMYYGTKAYGFSVRCLRDL
jgi:hypothetical protein